MTRNIKKMLCLLIAIIMIVSTFSGCIAEEVAIPEVIPEKQIFIDKYDIDDEITNSMTYRIDYMSSEWASMFSSMDVATMFDHVKVQVDDWDCVTIGITTMGEIVKFIEASNTNYVTSNENKIIAERQAIIDKEYEEAVQKAAEKGKTYDKPKKEVYTGDIHFDAPYTYTVTLGKDQKAVPEEYKPTLLVDPKTYNVIYFDVAKYGIPYVRFEFCNTYYIYNNRITQESDWVVNGVTAANVSSYAVDEEGNSLAEIPDFVDDDGLNRAAKQNIVMSGNIVFSGDGFTWDSLMLLCNALQLNWDSDNHGFKQSSDANFTYYTITIVANPFEAREYNGDENTIYAPSTRLVATFDPITQVCLNWTVDTYTTNTSYNNVSHDLSEPVDVNVHEYQVDTNDYEGMRNTIHDWISANSANITTEYCAINANDGEMLGIVDTGLVNLLIEPTINGITYSCLDVYSDSSDAPSGLYISVDDLNASEAIEDEAERDAYISEKAVDLIFSCSLLNEDNEIVADFDPTKTNMRIDDTLYYVVDYESSDGGYKNVRLLTEENVSKLIVLYTKTYKLNEEENAELLQILKDDGATALKPHINNKFADAEKTQKEQREQQAKQKLISESTEVNTNADLNTLTMSEKTFKLKNFSANDIMNLGYEPDGPFVQYDNMINFVGSSYKNEEMGYIRTVEQNGKVIALLAEDNDAVFYNGLHVGMAVDEVMAAIADESIVFENGTLILKSKSYTLILTLNSTGEVVEKIYLVSNDYYKTMPRQSATEDVSGSTDEVTEPTGEATEHTNETQAPTECLADEVSDETDSAGNG